MLHDNNRSFIIVFPQKKLTMKKLILTIAIAISCLLQYDS